MQHKRQRSTKIDVQTVGKSEWLKIKLDYELKQTQKCEDSLAD